jgi:hypothetical protein
MRATRQTRTLETVKPYSPHPPSYKQRLYLANDAEEAFYGGAAGGGKSDALLLAALQYVDVPEYSAGIFRRTKEDLNKPDAILARADRWFSGTSAKWDSVLHGYVFPSGATLHFGYGRNATELDDRYQGTTFHFIGPDELGQWDEEAYLYLFSRLRRHRGFPVPLRMRPAGNPGGRGAEWIRERFVEHAREPGGMTVREFLMRRKRGEPLPARPVFESPPSSEAASLARELGRKPQGAFFVPAFKEDNPGLDVDEYRLGLVHLDATRRAQLDDGDWWALPSGQWFESGWFQYIDEEPKAISWIRYWDLAGTKDERGKDPAWSAGVKLGIEWITGGGRRLVISHVTRFREEHAIVEEKLLETANADGKRVQIWIEQEPARAARRLFRRSLEESCSAGQSRAIRKRDRRRKCGNRSPPWRGRAGSSSFAAVGTLNSCASLSRYRMGKRTSGRRGGRAEHPDRNKGRRSPTPRARETLILTDSLNRRRALPLLFTQLVEAFSL